MCDNWFSWCLVLVVAHCSLCIGVYVCAFNAGFIITVSKGSDDGGTLVAVTEDLGSSYPDPWTVAAGVLFTACWPRHHVMLCCNYCLLAVNGAGVDGVCATETSAYNHNRNSCQSCE